MKHEHYFSIRSWGTKQKLRKNKINGLRCKLSYMYINVRRGFSKKKKGGVKRQKGRGVWACPGHAGGVKQHPEPSSHFCCAHLNAWQFLATALTQSQCEHSLGTFFYSCSFSVSFHVGVHITSSTDWRIIVHFGHNLRQCFTFHMPISSYATV